MHSSPLLPTYLPTYLPSVPPSGKDRDELQAGAITKASLTNQLKAAKYVFNPIVNLDISSGAENWKALGFYRNTKANPTNYQFYIPDGSKLGTYTEIKKPSYASYLDPGLEAGSSIDDYVSVTLDTGGSLYDLGMLRLQNADYTAVFVQSMADTQVKEIKQTESSGGIQAVTNNSTKNSEVGAETSGPSGSVQGDPHCKFPYFNQPHTHT